MTWELIPLKKITTKIGSGATPRGGNNSYKTEGITLIRSLNVHDLEFRYGGLAFIDEEQASETRLARVIVESKDILLNITGASVARCCIVPKHLLPARVNQHVSLVRVNPSLADSHYVLYCINSPVYKHQLLTLAQGGATREALTQEIIGNLEIPLPSIPIQHKIANFLERKTQQINELIRIRERRIELLQEQRTVLINQTVTKGLDPNVEMKPSGVEWIGEIPVHWEVLKVKHVGSSNPSKTNPKTACLKEKPVVFLPMERVHTDRTIDQELRLPYSQVKNGYTYFEENDILIAKVTPCFENGKIVLIKTLATPVGFGSTEFIVIRPNTQKVFSLFLYYLLYNAPLRSIGKYFMTSAVGLKRVPTEFVENFPIPIPPKQEQAQIANFLDRKTQQIDELIAAEGRKIELLKEYRQSLISEAVTGKIDVRNEV